MYKYAYFVRTLHINTYPHTPALAKAGAAPGITAGVKPIGFTCHLAASRKPQLRASQATTMSVFTVFKLAVGRAPKV